MRSSTRRQVGAVASTVAAFATLLSVHCESKMDDQSDDFYDPKLTRFKPWVLDSGTSAYARPSKCPDGMAYVEGFCIDRFEASLVYIKSGKPHPFYERPENFDLVMARSVPDVYPQGYLSQVESEKACNNAGKRLCSREEWLAACMGPNREKYSFWQDEYYQGICNNGRAPHVMSLYYGGNYPGHYWNNEQFNNPVVNVTPGYLSKTGAFPDCVSVYGVFDMEGNLHEWVSDVMPSGMGTFASSCYSDKVMGCSYYAGTHARVYHDYSTGFRCCSNSR